MRIIDEATNLMDSLIDFLESCLFDGPMPTAFYFVSVHPEGDAFRVQHISVGAFEQMAYLLGQAGANVMRSATGGASDT